jgi:hypothetical protein
MDQKMVLKLMLGIDEQLMLYQRLSSTKQMRKIDEETSQWHH